MAMTRASLVLMIAGALAVCPTRAFAQTFTAPCSDGLGDSGSLVHAIDEANFTPGADTVELGAACVYMFRTKGDNWYGPDALPAIRSEITIEGNGGAIARDPTAAPFRLFFVGADPANLSTAGYVSPGAGVLTLRDVSLTGGFAVGGDAQRGGGGAGMGGAIFNQGTVVVERSTLVRNTAEGGSATSEGGGPAGGGMGANSTDDHGGGFTVTSFPAGGVGGSAGTMGGGGGAGPASGRGWPRRRHRRPWCRRRPANRLGRRGRHPRRSKRRRRRGRRRHGRGCPGWRQGRWWLRRRRLEQRWWWRRWRRRDHQYQRAGRRRRVRRRRGWGWRRRPQRWRPRVRRRLAGGDQGRRRRRDGRRDLQHAGPPDDPRLYPRAQRRGRGHRQRAGSRQGHGRCDLQPQRKRHRGRFDVRGQRCDLRRRFDLQPRLRRPHRTHGGDDTIVADGIGGTDLVSSKTAYIYPANLGSAIVDAGQFDLVTSMVAREQGTITGTPLTADPQLGVLRDNGGQIATMAPAPGSPAIDAGSAFGVTSDQRGAPRPADFGSIANAGDGSDIGAYEAQAPGGAGSEGGGASSGGSRPAFGARTLVTLRLGAKRIPARGPVPVVVTNANRFAVSGRLAGATTSRRSVALATRSIRVRAAATATFQLALPKRLHLRLAHTGRLTLRLRAAVRDPAGHTRTVTKTVSVRRRRRHR